MIKTHADFTVPDFLLISGEGSDRCYQTRRSELLSNRSFALGFGGDWGHLSVFSIHPSDGIVSEVTEDYARAWWEHFGIPGEEVPAMFARFLEDEAAAPITADEQAANQAEYRRDCAA